LAITPARDREVAITSASLEHPASELQRRTVQQHEIDIGRAERLREPRR